MVGAFSDNTQKCKLCINLAYKELNGITIGFAKKLWQLFYLKLAW